MIFTIYLLDKGEIRNKTKIKLFLYHNYSVLLHLFIKTYYLLPNMAGGC